VLTVLSLSLGSLFLLALDGHSLLSLELLGALLCAGLLLVSFFLGLLSCLSSGI
jgi:hypothetical protein